MRLDFLVGLASVDLAIGHGQWTARQKRIMARAKKAVINFKIISFEIEVIL